MGGFLFSKIIERVDLFMYAQGWIRGYMSKSYDVESFMIHVVTTIERQLKLWDERVEVNLLQDLIGKHIYFVIVRFDEKTFKVPLSEEEARALQDESAFAVDRYIWRGLVKQGLSLRETEGNYLTYCAI